MTVGFYTLGCKLNQCETEALASSIRSKGFSIITSSGEADIYIVNTCAVTSRSEQKARRMIRSYANSHPGSLIIVTGCYAQLKRDAISSLAGNVVVVPQEEKSRLFDMFGDTSLVREGGLNPAGWEKSLQDARSGDARPPARKFAFTTDNYNFHSRAFLKIQDGCNARCAYCIVPFARGSSESLAPEAVYESIARLEQKGYREAVLTGVNVSAYDYDGLVLPALLSKICGSVTSVRIRLSSIEPESIDRELGTILAHKAICPHFHIPVQSGSDRILARMKRRYDSARLSEAVEILRSTKPGCFLGCDIIVGFPGETEEDFLRTKELVEKLQFSALHVFQFSARPGTQAYTMSDAVPENTKKKRAHALLSTSKHLLAEYVKGFEGHEKEAIIQQKDVNKVDSSSSWLGLTENYLKVKIHGIPEEQAKRGALARIRIDRADTISDSSFLGFL